MLGRLRPGLCRYFAVSRGKDVRIHELQTGICIKVLTGDASALSRRLADMAAGKQDAESSGEEDSAPTEAELYGRAERRRKALRKLQVEYVTLLQQAHTHVVQVLTPSIFLPPAVASRMRSR